MSPAEQQRWSKLRGLLNDLKPIYEEEAELPQTQTTPPVELQAPISIETVPPLEEIVLSQSLPAKEEPENPPIALEESPPLEEIVLSQALPAEEEPENQPIALEESPPIETELAFSQEVERAPAPPVQEELEESPPTQAQLALPVTSAAEETTGSPPVLDWNCSTRAFFESLPFEGERDYHREIPSQNWLSVPTAHFLEHLVPWYGLKHKHPDANLRQLVDLATQDAMKRAAQLQRLQTDEVTASAGHFFRNLNWQGVQRP